MSIIASWIFYIITIINMLYLGIRYIVATYKIQQIVVSTSPLYIIISLILPIGWWIYSTNFDYWNFYRRKRNNFTLVFVSTTMVLSQYIWTFTFNNIVTLICKIPVGRNFDANMIYVLCRIALIGITTLFGWGLYKIYEKYAYSEDGMEIIETFKLKHILDMRKNKENLYDLTILRDLETGKAIIIKEIDQFVHIFILGNSGTGKTSSTITPAVVCHFNTKTKNKSKRAREIRAMLDNGRAEVMPKIGSKEITEYDVVAVGDNDSELSKNERELENIRKKYADCGITIMAPNNSLNKDIVKLAKARNIKVNSIDPAWNYDEENVKNAGINPFYVELGLDPEIRQIQIGDKAQTFAEVLQAVNEIQAPTDQYFRDISTSVTSNIATVCMLEANLNGKQTNIVEIQRCINDFKKLRKKVDDIESLLHFKIIIEEPENKKDKNNNTVERKDAVKQKKFNPADVNEDGIIYTEVTEKDIPEKYRKENMSLEKYTEILRTEAENYYETLYFVKTELIGEGYEKMYDQARGLRNLINKLLFDRRIKRILSANEENFIDWDKALENNEITVINTALEFGAQGSTALGLFLMLSFKISVLRRPQDLRSNHFLFIDEAAQYMHPMYEDMFQLFRQYRVSATIAMQSIAQMRKNKTTAYLEDVIMGAGTHILFGRLSADEMDYYEKLSGIKRKESKQTTVSGNSEYDLNYNITHSERTTVEESKTVTADQMRHRDFQEVTVNMIDEGRVKDSFLAKVFFPKKSEYKDKYVSEIKWSKYLPEGFSLEELSAPMPVQNQIAKDQLEKAKTNITNTNVIDKKDMITTLPDIEEIDELDNSKLYIDTDIMKARKAQIGLLNDKIKSGINEESIIQINRDIARRTSENDESEKYNINDNRTSPKMREESNARKRQTKNEDRSRRVDENINLGFFNVDEMEDTEIEKMLEQMQSEKRS